MNQKVKRILSALIIVASIVLVGFIAFGNSDIGNTWHSFARMDIKWLTALFLCWVAYWFFEACGVWSYLRSKGYGIHLGRVIGVSLIGFYYSNITPSAAGGQPMQVSSLRKAGIPVAYGTTAVTIRFISNQLMICLISLVLFIANRSFAYGQLEGAMWVVRIGWTINFLAVPLVLLAAFKRNWIQALAGRLIALLAKIRLVRDRQATTAKVTEILDSYHEAMISLIHSPGQILLQMLYSTLSLLGLTGSIVFAYYAFGLRGMPWYRILTISTLLFVSASYTPLPGASGAQEGGFMLYFKGIFTDGTIGAALLVWRFFTYYLFLIVGVGTVINDKLLVRRETRRKQKQAEQVSLDQDTEGNGEGSEEQAEQRNGDDAQQGG